jgi:predicted TIM-barrel fold metal-dependent hydrolase
MLSLVGIDSQHDEFGVRAFAAFNAGYNPQVGIADATMYPIYAKCVELGVPIFSCAGVPGPPRDRTVPMMIGPGMPVLRMCFALDWRGAARACVRNREFGLAPRCRHTGAPRTASIPHFFYLLLYGM